MTELTGTRTTLNPVSLKLQKLHPLSKPCSPKILDLKNVAFIELIEHRRAGDQQSHPS